MYHEISAEVLGLIEPIAEQHSLEIVDAELRRGQGPSLLRVIVDTPAGDGRVTVDQCAAVSREVGHCLDAAELIPGAYRLEVSSPGVDRVLGRKIDFKRSVGNQVSVETRDLLDGRRRFKGELVAFEDHCARVRIDSDEYSIPFDVIRRAKAFYRFAPGELKR